MKLNELRESPGARKARKRVGRGIGSGVGKTSGRGVKGQKSRSGVAIKGFEGGQMPLYRRLPKRGFNNIFSKSYNIVSLTRVQQAVDAGRIDASHPVTNEVLRSCGMVRRLHDGLRVLNGAGLKTKLTFEVSGASKTAVKAIEATGGTISFVGDKSEKSAGPKKAEKS